MNKTIKHYSLVLDIIGVINASLIVLSINSTLVLNFPEYDGLVHSWNVFGVLALLIPLLVAAEKKGEKKIWKIILLALSFLSIPLSKGNVAATSWTLSLLIFMIPALFAPRPRGKLLMTRPRIWSVLVFLVAYGVGNISGLVELMSLEVVVIYVFFVIWVLCINIDGCLKKIRDGKGDVEVDSILKQNRREIIVFIIVFSLISLLLPAVINGLRGERKESTVVYEWGEEGETEEDGSNYLPLSKDKGISKESEAFDLSLLGNVLMWIFIAVVVGFFLLEIGVVIMRIKGIDGRKENHRDQFTDDFTLEVITDKKEIEKKKMKIFLSTEEKIRRLYKKTVEKRQHGENIASLTTKEIDKEILSFDSYDFSSIYEDTRYSGKKMDTADYERMKESLKREKKSSK